MEYKVNCIQAINFLFIHNEANETQKISQNLENWGHDSFRCILVVASHLSQNANHALTLGHL